jgi:hypothetical protein
MVEMLAKVLQHVHERVPDLARSAEHVRMVAPVPDAPSPPQQPIDRSRHADGEPLYAAREPRRLVRFDQQVEMIGLNAVVKETEGIPRSRPKRA